MNMRAQMSIGNRILQRREQLGLTRQALGEISNVDHKQIWRYEKGINIPSAEVIATFAEAMNVSADWLLGLTDEIRPIPSDSNLSPDEIDLLNLYRSKSADLQRKLLDIARVV